MLVNFPFFLSTSIVVLEELKVVNSNAEASGREEHRAPTLAIRIQLSKRFVYVNSNTVAKDNVLRLPIPSKHSELRRELRRWIMKRLHVPDKHDCS